MKCIAIIEDIIEPRNPIPKLKIGTLFLLRYMDHIHIVMKYFNGYVSLTEPRLNWLAGNEPNDGFIRVLKSSEKVTLSND